MTEYRHLSAAETLEALPALQDVYMAVFALPPYDEGPEMRDKFAGWVRDESKEPGFDLVTATESGRVVGFAYGYGRPAGQWWHWAQQPIPDEIGGEGTFAVMEWAVVPDARGHGVGQALMDELLRNRPEPWATLTVNPAADARAVYERRGWQQVDQTRPGKMPSMDVMVLKLRNPSADDR